MPFETEIFRSVRRGFSYDSGEYSVDIIPSGERGDEPRSPRTLLPRRLTRRLYPRENIYLTSENVPEMQENPERRKCCTCPYRRYYIAFMMMAGYFLLYSTRVNLSVAIVYMTEKKMKNVNGTESPEREFNWDENLQGYALASFFYGYILTQIPGGYLSGVIGGNHVLSVGVIGSGLLTFVAPTAAVYSFAALVAVRVGCGLLQGLTIPASNSVLSKWAPPYERTVLSGMAISGNFMSPVIVMPVCNVIGRFLGWEWMFYVFGIASCVWGIIWVLTTSTTPAKDKFITQGEREFIQQSIGEGPASKFAHPWKGIFCSLAVWAVIVAHTCHNWGYYTVLLYGPKFFRETEGFNMSVAVFFGANGFFVMFLLLGICSVGVDIIRSKTKLSTETVRKIFAGTGFLLQALFMLLAALVYVKPLTVASVILGVGLGGVTWSGFYANPLDIATPHAAVISGLSNTFATLPGIISPYITAQIIPNEDPVTSDWLWVWTICAILYTFGALFYCLFAKGETQSWVVTEEE